MTALKQSAPAASLVALDMSSVIQKLDESRSKIEHLNEVIKKKTDDVDKLTANGKTQEANCKMQVIGILQNDKEQLENLCTTFETQLVSLQKRKCQFKEMDSKLRDCRTNAISTYRICRIIETTAEEVEI